MSRSARGFTLLEVLVAISIFAIMSSLAYAGLTRMIEGRDRIEAERERWRLLALAFVQLEDDLSQVRGRTVRNAIGTPIDAFIMRPVDSRALGEPSLEFTRGGLFVSGDGATTGLQRVAYQLKDGVLWRLTWPTLDRAPDAKPRETKLLSDVDNLTINPKGQGIGSSPNWPPLTTQSQTTAQTSYPPAVEVAFDVAGVGRVQRTLLVAQ